MYEASLSCSPTLMYIPTPDLQQEYILPQQDTGIVDSGAAQTVIHKPPNKENLMYEASLSCSPTQTYMPTLCKENVWVQEQHTYALPQTHHMDR